MLVDGKGVGEPWSPPEGSGCMGTHWSPGLPHWLYMQHIPYSPALGAQRAAPDFCGTPQGGLEQSRGPREPT